MSSLLNRINRFLLKKFYLLKYRKSIFVKGNVEFGRRVIVRSFGNNRDHLRIIFQGNNKIRNDVIFQGKGTIEVGVNSYISSFSVLGSNESIRIGNNCMIAQNVSIRDTDHKFDSLKKPMIDQGIITKPINIEDDVWIGFGAVVTKGVVIGKGSIIGANAVVTKDVQEYSIMGGVPAKLIRKRTGT